MRIIAGKYRSRPIRPVPGMDVRPTSDRLRETLFNVLASAHRLEESRWIDLFAGTGAIGIEALSRGAACVYFVERSPKVARIIEANLQSIGIANGGDIVIREFAAGLHELANRGIVCDFLFFDPPYREEGVYDATLRILSSSPLISPQTIVIAEHTKHFDPGDGIAPLSRYRRHNQGDASLSFYRLSPNQSLGPLAGC